MRGANRLQYYIKVDTQITLKWGLKGTMRKAKKYVKNPNIRYVEVGLSSWYGHLPMYVLKNVDSGVLGGSIK